MSNIFGLPGISSPISAFSGDVGFLTVSDPSSILRPLLVQTYTLSFKERVNTVYTLSETSHVYVFGKELAYITLVAFALNSSTVEGSNSAVNSSTLIDLWSNTLRAKQSGVTGNPTLQVFISSLSRTFLCIPQSFDISQGIQDEALFNVNISSLVIDEITHKVV